SKAMLNGGSAEPDIVEVVVAETEVVSGLVENGNANLLDHFRPRPADALDVALVELNAIELGAAADRQLLGVWDAGDDSEGSRIDSVFDQRLRGIVGRDDR